MSDYHLAYTAMMQENVKLKKELEQEAKADEEINELVKKLQDDLEAKEALLAEAGEMLDNLEFGQVYDYGFIDVCHVCGEYKENGHKPDCKLSALIQKIRSAK